MARTLKDKTTPGSKTAPDFMITPSHTIACLSLQPSSMVALSHIQEPSIETFDPIEHPSPITEFVILVLFPILVPLPMTVKGPICAERDSPMSEEKLVYQITHNKIKKIANRLSLKLADNHFRSNQACYYYVYRADHPTNFQNFIKCY